MGDILQKNRLAGARRRNDQSALSLSERRYEIDDTRRIVLLRRIIDFHFDPRVGIKRGKIIEMDLVAARFGVLEIDRVYLQQCEIALAILWATDLAFHRVAGAQTEPANLARAYIDIVGAGEVIGIR